MEFVVAKSKEAATRIGKRLEKERRADNAINAHLSRAMTLDDNQLTAAMAIVRGDVSVRDNQTYHAFDLGQWTKNDDDLRQEVCKTCSLTMQEVENICWSFVGKADDSSECDGDECPGLACDSDTDDDDDDNRDSDVQREQLIDDFDSSTKLSKRSERPSS